MARRRLPIPAHTQMGGITIDVQIGEWPGMEIDDCGQWLEDRDRIVLVRGMPRERTEQTYVHELIEAANTVAELGLKHHQIEALASLLHQALTTRG